MARVKNQVLFEDEESYTDAGGSVHYNGVGYRQGATEAYPGYLGAEYGTVRKSPRSRRPPQQGRGSPLQAPWRDCFIQCAARWSTLPDACADIPVCDPSSSKERIYDAKVEAGVSCSAYDLYMRCCMQNCVTIDISGPGGVTYSGGVIPDDEPCFPCDSDFSGYSIAAPPPIIGASESVQLSVDPQLPPGTSFTIVLASGGGSLSPSFMYTAPAENTNCLLSPVFDLIVCDNRISSFSLAVSTAPPGTPAYRLRGNCIVLRQEGYCRCACGWSPIAEYNYRNMDCDGNFISYSTYESSYGMGPCAADDYPYPTPCDCNGLPLVIDIRTPDAVRIGCCPPVF